MLLGMGWAEVIPGIRYYAGSFANTSRFTTRVHTIFESHAAPDHQMVLPVLRLFKTSVQSGEAGGTYDLRTISRNDLSPEEVPAGLLIVASQSHHLLSDSHRVHITRVLRDGACAAILLHHQAVAELTAANVLQYLWVVVQDGQVDIPSLVRFLRSNAAYSDATIQIVTDVDVNTNRESLSIEGEREVPAFWTLNHKDDLGPLVGSIYRAVYAVLRKYGDEGVAEIASTFRG
jgi:hypothetical protein